LIGGDFNAEQHELGIVVVLGRAGWADWGSEATCITANTKRPRRIDQVWVSPEMQARLLKVELSWATGLKTHAWQQGEFRSGEPDKFMKWHLGDAGPEAEEEGFTDLEFATQFVQVVAEWEAARLRGDVNCMWQVLEETLVQCHRHRSPAFKQPRATTRLASEEPRRDLRSGEALTRALTEASRRKRRLQQWLCLAGRPECQEQLRQLKHAMAGDSDPSWAGVALLEPPRLVIEELVLKARAEEDQARTAAKEARRAAWRKWCLAETEGGMRAFFR
jgi:hypothetical protein